SDETEAIARSFPWVEVERRDRPPETQFMRQHQNACAAMALEKARGEGFDWLLHLDADELAFGSDPATREAGDRSPGWLERLFKPPHKQALQRADLIEMLAGIAPDTQQVILRTHEAFPLRLPRAEDFWQNPYFQSGEPFIQRILDPTTGKKMKFDRYLGHDKGKSIVRTAADVQAFNPHGWTTNQNIVAPEFPQEIPIPTEERGCHFHYLVVTAEQWRKKFGAFDGLAKNWPSGVPLAFPKSAWREAALTMTEQVAGDYLDEWVFRTRDALDELARQGELQIEPEVAQILHRFLSRSF
ncbi:MAG: hypothetical protein ACI9NC_003978, partial [Verrucomicrobiales bacterium]